jgi:hypothetical protein
VAARSKPWSIFFRSNAEIVGSNPTRGIDVCLRLFCVCVVLCLGSGLATGWSLVQGVLPTVYRLRNWSEIAFHGCQILQAGAASRCTDRLMPWEYYKLMNLVTYQCCNESRAEPSIRVEYSWFLFRKARFQTQAWIPIILRVFVVFLNCSRHMLI